MVILVTHIAFLIKRKRVDQELSNSREVIKIEKNLFDYQIDKKTNIQPRIMLLEIWN